jgi:hypothetical protein
MCLLLEPVAVPRKTPARPLCRHGCGRAATTNKTDGTLSNYGLCYRCCCTPAIRKLYVPASAQRQGREGYVGCQGAERTLPEPTRAPPGSAEKVRVLEERAASNQLLWHPEDGPRDEQTPQSDAALIAWFLAASLDVDED